MPELIEPDPQTIATLAETLARQAAALHFIFMRTFADILSNKDRSLRDVGRALKAQNQCRIALRLLIALCALEQSQKKSRNRTNRLLKAENSPHDQALGKATPNVRLCQAEAPPQRIGVVGGTPRPARGTHPHVRAMEKVDRAAN